MRNPNSFQNAAEQPNFALKKKEDQERIKQQENTQSTTGWRETAPCRSMSYSKGRQRLADLQRVI
jgi:hypothetical protein